MAQKFLTQSKVLFYIKIRWFIFLTKVSKTSGCRNFWTVALLKTCFLSKILILLPKICHLPIFRILQQNCYNLLVKSCKVKILQLASVRKWAHAEREWFSFHAEIWAENNKVRFFILIYFTAYIWIRPKKKQPPHWALPILRKKNEIMRISWSKLSFF